MVEELITKLRLLFDDVGVDRAKKSIRDLEGTADAANKATTGGAERSSAAMGQAGAAAKRLGDDLSTTGAKAADVGQAGETAGRRTTAGADGARGAVRGLGEELAVAGAKGADAGDRIGRGAQEAERRTGSARGAVAGLAAGLVAIGAAAYFGGILKDLGEVDRLAIQTQTTIRTTGGVANVTAAHVADLGDAFERTTGLESELTQQSENLLLTFTGVRNEVGRGNDVFDRATKLSQDLATAGFGSASSAAIGLGKALNDPIAGISALSKQGLTFTEGQKATIRSLVATNDLLGAQRIILDELERQVGGSAEAFGTTLPGRLARARNAIDNVSEGFVSALVPGLEAAAKAVVPLAEAFGSMPPALQTVASVLLVVGAGALLFGGRLREGVSAIKEMVASIPALEAKSAAGAGALRLVGGAAGFLGRALAAVGVYVVARSFVDNLAPSADKSAEALSRSRASADEFYSSLRKLNHPSLWEGFLSGVRDSLKLDWNTAEVKAGSYFRTLAEKSPVAAQSVISSMHEQGQATGEFQGILDEVVRKLAAAGVSEETLSGKVKAATVAQRDQAAASGDLGAKQDQLRSRFDALNDSVDRFKSLLDATLGVQITSTEASLRANEALAGLHTALEENGTSLDLSTEKGRNNQRAVLDLIGAVEGEIDAWSRSGAITDDDASRKGALIKRFQDLQREFPPLRDHIQGYIDKINAIPVEPVTTPKVDTGPASAAIEGLITQFRRLRSEGESTTAVRAVVGAGGAPGRMAGGPVRADQPVVVGERRAEIWWPDRPGTILPDVSLLERLARGTSAGPSVSVTLAAGAVAIDARGVPGVDVLADTLSSLVEGQIAATFERVVSRELAYSLSR